MSDLRDIGGGHFIEFVSHKHPDGSTHEAAGLLDFHPAKDGVSHLTGPDALDPSTLWCGGVVFWCEVANRTTWTLESMDPLTLSPSLLCVCGDHGFIREGGWVDA